MCHKFLILTLSIVGLLWSSQTFALSLLYNPSPTRRCFQHVEASEASGWLTPGYFDVNDECHLDGNPANACPSWIASDKSCPAWYAVTWNWNQATKDVYPGWGLWVIGGWGSPIELVAQSNAKPTSIPSCSVRETTAIDYAWPDASLKRQANYQPYKINSFSAIRWKFDAKLKHYNGPPNCTSFPAAYVTADFGVRFPNGTVYVIGVILFNGNGFDPNGNPNDNVYWSSWNPSNDTCGGVDKDSPSVVLRSF